MQQKESNTEGSLVTLSKAFISNWFTKSITERSNELSDFFILPGKKILEKRPVVKKMKRIFDSSSEFTGGRYDIIDVGFELMGEDKGIGYVEGVAGYRVIFKSQESKIVSGPFKLYFALQTGSWKIVNIEFPGFEY